jgi:hypothetical protein
MVGVTCLQMVLVLLFVQIALPDTADQLHKKVNGTSMDVCTLPHGDPNRPDAACYAQGPLTLPKLVYSCPILLCNGLMNVLYYFGEATMYREPMGVLLIVMCALTSTFLVAPLQDWLGTGASKPPGAFAIVFGLAGALLCSVERSVKALKQAGASEQAALESRRSRELLDESGDRNDEAPAADDLNEGAHDPEVKPPPLVSKEAVTRFLRVFPLIVPFAGLSVAYALYFCMMQWYDQKCNANPWGYNSVDQVGLPLYMYPAMFLANLWTDWMHNRRERAAAAAAAATGAAPTIQTVEDGQPREDAAEAVSGEEDALVNGAAAPVEYETFWQAVKHSVRENTADYGQGFAFMFMYRLLINGRAISYFFIAVEYDLSEAYFVLTLVRVLLSWLISLCLVLVVPRYINTDAAEKAQLLDRYNLAAKCIGSVCVILSLLCIDGIIF